MKIERLQDMKKELNRMIIQCAGELVSNCRLVEVLSDHRLCLSEEQEKPWNSLRIQITANTVIYIMRNSDSIDTWRIGPFQLTDSDPNSRDYGVSSVRW